MNCIIFKDGKAKTIEYAKRHDIKLLNPLWVHESNIENKLLDVDKYLIKKTLAETSIQKNIPNINQDNKAVKRKHQEAINNVIDIKNRETTDDIIKPKKKLESIKVEKTQTPNNKQILTPTSTAITKQEILSSANKTTVLESNKKTAKITQFFQKQESNKKINLKEETDPDANIKEDNTPVIEPLNYSYKVGSIYLSEMDKLKIIKCSKSIGIYRYIGDNLKSISQSDYVIVANNFNKNDTRIVYCVLNNLKLIKLDFFVESLNNKEYLDINNYITSIKIKEDDNKVLKDNKIFLHPSLFDFEPTNELKKKIMVEIIKRIGCEDIIVDKLRLSTICIINKLDENEYFPGHIKLINQNFLYDCFYNKKLCEVEDIKYNPEVTKSK